MKIGWSGSHLTSRSARLSRSSGDAPQVWVVGDEGKVHHRDVQLLKFDADSVVISGGLSAGEKVVTAGINTLREGQKVRLADAAAGGRID